MRSADRPGILERVSGPDPSEARRADRGPVIRGSVRLPESELRWRFSRSSGPGGQHVNTTDTQVELLFDLAATRALPEAWRRRALERLAGKLHDGVVVVRAAEHRSQWRNRQAALTRMAALLAEASAPPPPPRKARRTSRGAQERRLRDKKHRADLKRGRSPGRGSSDGW